MSASSSSPFAVETVVQLLKGTPDADFANAGDAPDRIQPIWESEHQTRVNYPNPACYVWSPTDITIEKFSADADSQLETATIEVVIMTLDATLTKEYQRDVTQILGDYWEDVTNSSTDFYEISPDSQSDLRNENRPGETDHYMATVTAELSKFRSAGT